MVLGDPSTMQNIGLFTDLVPEAVGDEFSIADSRAPLTVAPSGLIRLFAASQSSSSPLVTISQVGMFTTTVAPYTSYNTYHKFAEKFANCHQVTNE